MTAREVKASIFGHISMDGLKQFCHIDSNQTEYLQRMNIAHDLTLAQTLRREHIIYIVHKPFKNEEIPTYGTCGVGRPVQASSIPEPMCFSSVLHLHMDHMLY